MRRGVADLFVATEPLRGWRELNVEDDHRAATWVRFVARLMDMTCRDAKKVRWIMDNPGMQKVSFFYDHFPPPTWPGRICSGWKSVSPPFTARGLTSRKSSSPSSATKSSTTPFADKAAVQAAVERWKNRQNAQPKLRNWQFTTADARTNLTRLYPTT